jgi:hypothetical protein
MRRRSKKYIKFIGSISITQRIKAILHENSLKRLAYTDLKQNNMAMAI